MERNWGHHFCPRLIWDPGRRWPHKLPTPTYHGKPHQRTLRGPVWSGRRSLGLMWFGRYFPVPMCPLRVQRSWIERHWASWEPPGEGEVVPEQRRVGETLRRLCGANKSNSGLSQPERNQSVSDSSNTSRKPRPSGHHAHSNPRLLPHGWDWPLHLSNHPTLLLISQGPVIYSPFPYIYTSLQKVEHFPWRPRKTVSATAFNQVHWTL